MKNQIDAGELSSNVRRWVVAFGACNNSWPLLAIRAGAAALALPLSGCLPPPPPPQSITFDTIDYKIYTGGDDLRSSSSAVASIFIPNTNTTWTFGGPNSSIPLPSGVPIIYKPLNNGQGWGNDTLHEVSYQLRNQSITLLTPIAPPFPIASTTIQLLQGSCLGCTSDNWDIEGLQVRLLQSNGIHSICLIQMGFFGPGDHGEKPSIARLKEGPMVSSTTVPANVVTVPNSPAPCVNQ